MKLLIIGSDSFIAKKFIAQNTDWRIKGIARSKTTLVEEAVLQDFFLINNSVFQNIDMIINFAAIVHQPKQKDINIYNRINYELPVFLAKNAKENGVKHFIQMSTIAVYGEQEKISIDSAYNPTTPYGRSKLKADEELLATQYDNFKISIIRPSMVYGGGAAPGNMMQLIKLASKGLPVPFKNVNNARQFCYVGLLVDVLTKITEQGKEGIFLVADKTGISTSEILIEIEKELEKKVRQIVPPALFLKFLKRIKPSLFQKLYGNLIIDCEATFKLLGIDSNKYSFQEGIQEMVKAFLE